MEKPKTPKSADRLSFALIRNRAVVLLALLIVCKAGTIAILGNDIYQDHWRIIHRPQSWIDIGAYLVFLGLIAASSWLVGAGLATARPGRSRLFFGFSLVFSLIFVFFSFHVLEKNYLQSILDKVLTWRQIGYYLQLETFFAPPYLAVYLGAGALLYWVLLRTGREWWAFPIFGLGAVVFLILNVRSPFDYGRDLLLADCLGVAGVAGLLLSRQALSIKWQAATLLPGMLTLVTFAVLLATPPKLEPCARELLCATAALTIIGIVLIQGTPAQRPVSFLLPFWAVAFFLLCSHDYPFSANLNQAVRCGLAWPRYVFPDFAVVLILLGAAWVAHRKAPVLARIVFDISALALVNASLMDLFVTRTLGFRLDWNALVISNDPVLLWRTIRPHIAPAALGIAGCAAVYFTVPWASGRIIQPSWRVPAAARGTAVYVLGFGFLVVLLSNSIVEDDKGRRSAYWNLLVTSPAMAWMNPESIKTEEFMATANEIGIGAATRSSTEKRKVAARSADLNVVLVILESSYNRYLSLFGAPDDTQPLLARYVDRMELFPNFYSNYPSSLNARFSVLSGLYACKPFVTYVNPRIDSPALFDIFHERGYKVSLFDSCYRSYQRWDDYLRFRPIDVFYDTDSMPGRENSEHVSWGLKEEVTLKAMKQQFALHASNHEKFFLTYVPVMPHMPFDTVDKQFEKFDNGFPMITKDYSGRYKNQLLYIDWVLASMLDELQRLELLDKTLFVITDDHGEMVGENHEALGHGWNVSPRLCNVPLIIMDPRKRGKRINPVLGSQVDVLPTILDLMDIPVPAGELYEGVSLYSDEASHERPIYITSPQQRAVIRGSHYFLEDVAPGQTEADSARVFEITHQGTKTEFRQIDEKANISKEMNRFDRFQKNLILRYAYWKRQYQNKARSDKGGN